MKCEYQLHARQKHASRALSTPSKEQCKCDASCCGADVFQLARYRIKRPVYERKCANFWAGSMPALSNLSCHLRQRVGRRDDSTALPDQVCLALQSIRVHCCPREQSDSGRTQRSQILFPEARRGPLLVVVAARFPKWCQRRVRPTRQVGCVRTATRCLLCRVQSRDSQRRTHER